MVCNLLFKTHEDNPYLVHPAGALLATGPDHVGDISFSLVAVYSLPDRRPHPGSAHQVFEDIILSSISPHATNLSQVSFATNLPGQAFFVPWCPCLAAGGLWL